MKFNIVMTEDEALHEAGYRLAQIRLGRNLSQVELAAKAEVRDDFIAKIDTRLKS